MLRRSQGERAKGALNHHEDQNGSFDVAVNGLAVTIAAQNGIISTESCRLSEKIGRSAQERQEQLEKSDV